jgi:DNA polymerase-3 subunit delta'
MSMNTSNSSAIKAEARFLTAVKTGRVSHACFLSCLDTLFAEQAARRAAALFCTGAAEAGRLSSCVDYTELGSEPIKADMVRAVTAELTKRSFSGGGRAIYLKNAHTMNEPAQNALLKTLEEPPEGTLFLLTGNEHALLPTIRSRCSRVTLPAPGKEEVAAALRGVGANEAEALRYAAMGITSGRALRLYQDEEYRALREKAQALLCAVLSGKLPFEGIAALAGGGEDAAVFMLSLLRDILLYKTRGLVAENADRQAEAAKFAARFTNGRIHDMITVLAESLARLNTNVSAQAVFTWTFTQLAKEISQTG